LLKVATDSLKAATVPLAQPANFPTMPEILDLDTMGSTTSTRRTPEARSNRTTTVSEIIDLTESPEAHRSARVHAPRTQAAEIIDLSEIPPPAPLTPSHSVTAKVIDLSLDSPELVPQKLPELPSTDLPLPPRAASLPVAVDLPSMEDDPGRIPASSRQPTSKSPSLSELAHPDTPTPPSTPNTIVRFPSMDVDDDVDQKPLFSLLQKLAVSDDSRGGTLGPAWMRERYETSDHMAMWKRFVEKQKVSKPLSRRKPKKTQLVDDIHKSFVVLPFVDSKPYS
jgi:hypothetical protein